jgi:hypothetical protein
MGGLRSWHTGGVAVRDFPLLPSFSLPPLPLFSFPAAANKGKRGKPLLNLGLQEGLSSGGIRARSRRRKGKDKVARPGWLARRGHRRGVTAVDGDVAFVVAVEGIGVFSPGESPMLAHRRALARRACQPAARPSQRMHTRVRRGAVGRLLGRKGEEEKDMADGWGQSAIERKEKEESCWMLGCVDG